jgi:chromosome segregation ATPase
MSIFGFFAKAKLQQSGEKAAELLASIDPEGMTEAGIGELEGKLKEISLEAAAAKNEFQKEQAEADSARNLYNRRLRAAEKLDADLQAAPESTEIQAALTEILRLLETTTAEVEREEREAVEAKQILDELEAAAREIADELRQLRESAKHAQQEMEKAARERERAEKAEDRAKRLTGIKAKGSGFSAAIDAMQRAAEKERQHAEAAKLRAEVLTPPKAPENRLIDEALAAVSGVSTPAPGGESLSDRLARLKGG